MPAVTVTETVGDIISKTEFEEFSDYERYLELTGGEASLMGGTVKPPKQNEEQ